MLAELETLNGLPAHPLIVHLPVVLVPLALFGAISALVRPSWRSWAVPLTAVFATVSLFGVQLAIMSGEGLEELSGEGGEAAIERHAQLAEQARPIVFAFFAVAVAAAVIQFLLGRSDDAPGSATLRKLAVPVLALSVLTGALSTAWVYRTGHSGAESVWKGEGEREAGEDGD